MEKYMYNLKEHQIIRTWAGVSQISDCGFTKLVRGKIYLASYINNQYLWFKNNIAQLYFILGRADLCCNLSILPLIFIDFLTVHLVKTHFLMENMWIQNILRYTGKISNLTNIKLYCAVSMNSINLLRLPKSFCLVFYMYHVHILSDLSMIL